MDFKKNKLAKFSLALLCILLISVSVSASVIFAVDEPDGTSDETSAYYDVELTPQFANDATGNMADDNTITCYADPLSSGYSTTIELFNRTPCCDTNQFRVNVAALGTRSAGGKYYVWCINDQNSDMNAYSGGQFTLSRFTSVDIGLLAIDIVGGIVGGVVMNINAIGILFALIIIFALLLDIFTGVFGIFNKLKDLSGRRG